MLCWPAAFWRGSLQTKDREGNRGQAGRSSLLNEDADGLAASVVVVQGQVDVSALGLRGSAKLLARQSLCAEDVVTVSEDEVIYSQPGHGIANREN